MNTRGKISKFLSSLFVNRQGKSTKKIEIKYDKSKFREVAKTILGHTETKSINIDYQASIQILYSKNKINITPTQENIPKAENNEQENTQKEVLEKAEKEDEKIYSNFFNEFSLIILQNSNKEKLLDLACKSFVGNTDVPKDHNRSLAILQLAKAKISYTSNKSEHEMNIDEDIIFFHDYFQMLSSVDTNNIQKAQRNLIEQNHMIKSKYIYARDLFKTLFFQIRFSNYLKDGEIYLSNFQKDEFMAKCFYIFEEASQKGIYEANYFLGLMHSNGCYTKVNKNLAYFYFSKSASYTHSLSFYELYRMVKLREIDIYKEENTRKKVMFDYLKNAAEEGYVEAMYELGNEYIKGEMTKSNYELAYAWHRQACRNGYILSYEPCGDLLYNGSDELKQNKSLAFIMYFTGYRMGLIDLEKKMIDIRNELSENGEPFAEIVKNLN